MKQRLAEEQTNTRGAINRLTQARAVHARRIQKLDVCVAAGSVHQEEVIVRGVAFAKLVEMAAHARPGRVKDVVGALRHVSMPVASKKDIKEQLSSVYPPGIVLVQWLSHVRLSETPWTAARQAPPSVEFSKQEHWTGLPCPPPGGSSQPRDQTRISYISCIGWRVLYHWRHLGSSHTHTYIYTCCVCMYACCILETILLQFQLYFNC